MVGRIHRRGQRKDFDAVGDVLRRLQRRQVDADDAAVFEAAAQFSHSSAAAASGFEICAAVGQQTAKSRIKTDD